jgi:hypothetical protein
MSRLRSDTMAQLPFCSHCFALRKPVLDYTSHFGYDHAFGRYKLNILESIDESKETDESVDYASVQFLLLPIEEQNTTLGECLYRAIAVKHPELAREVTNAILQVVTVPQLIRWIENPGLIEEAIDQFLDTEHYDDVVNDDDDE